MQSMMNGQKFRYERVEDLLLRMTVDENII